MKPVSTFFEHVSLCEDFEHVLHEFVYAPASDSRLSDSVLRTDWDKYFKKRQLGPMFGRNETPEVTGVTLGLTGTSSPSGLEMSERDGVYSLQVPLSPGLYHYRFGVECRGFEEHRIWLDDPHANGDLQRPVLSAPGFKESGVLIAPQWNGSADWETGCRARMDEVAGGRQGLRVVAPDNVVSVRYRSATSEVVVPLVGGGGGLRYFHTIVDPTAAGVAGRVLFVTNDGRQMEGAVDEHGRVQVTLASCALKRATTPAWAADAIWYTLIPDRFRVGGRAGGEGERALEKWRSDYNSLLSSEKTYYPDVFFRRYGGNLAGIAEKLPYLKALGVNVLCLTPVFAAGSYHGYDTTDFRHIEPELGSDPEGDRERLARAQETEDPSTWLETQADLDFMDLMKSCHANGIRVVVDGVFSHVGEDFWAFKDVRARGAKSPYTDWFWMRDPPAVGSDQLDYECFFGMGHLPKLRWSDEGLNEGAQRHIFAITERWMAPRGRSALEYGIDGWRLDVANELPMAFWRQWRKLVKAVNPEALILGEMLGTSYERYLDGTTLDAIINYRFGSVAFRYFGNDRNAVKTPEIIDELNRLKCGFADSVVFSMQNVLDSHDLDRAVSGLRNRNRPYGTKNKLQYPDHNYDGSKPNAIDYQILRMLVAFQVVCPGAPHLLYGTEAGMWGATDPNCRKPMLWDDIGEFEEECLSYPTDACYRLSVDRPVFDHLLHGDLLQLLRLRGQFAALRCGNTFNVAERRERNALAIVRFDGSGFVVGVFNNELRACSLEFELEELQSPRTEDQDLVTLAGNCQARIEHRLLRVSLPMKAFGIFTLAEKGRTHAA